MSSKYAEASKLNAAFELNLQNAMDFVRSEQVHLRHRITEVCADADEEQHLLDQIEPLFEQFVSEIDVGLGTAQNTYKTIENSSRLSSLRKWDECIALLNRHVAASVYQIDRCERAINQFHRVLDGAQDHVSEED
ncbi:MAG: hypothetical protein ACRBBO_01040 [Cognatishimia sp.]